MYQLSMEFLKHTCVYTLLPNPKNQ